MKLVDLNLLLYATNRDAPGHEEAREWWEQTLSREETVGLAWVVVLGFLRITTRPAIFSQPLTPEQAIDTVSSWLSLPVVVEIHPGARHWSILQSLLRQSGTAANLTTDAHLAALAIEYDATLCSRDHDFRRFEPELRFLDPLR
ncbi:MAG: type II toxin-antitoxin system VapC family toxin [Vulcanimicrobiota bacterium]